MTVVVRNPTLAAFDFDGTLTRGESFLRFLLFVTPWYRRPGYLLRSLPFMLAYVAGLMSNAAAKQRVVTIFLKGRARSEVLPLAVRFARERIAKTLRPEAVARLNHHLKQGHACVLVSATLALYLEPWGAHMGFDSVLATGLQVDERGRFTGRLSTPNCFGAAKAERIKAHYGVEHILAAYGDSRGDREMLAMAEQPGYRLWH